MPRPVNKGGRYIPGLDGLRAIAVLAVIAYHLGWNGAQGGLLGVGMFFVLSGYLITDLMIAERGRNGSIDMKRFWGRRARRLLPAMLTMVAAVSAWLLLTDPGRLASIGGDIAASLLYVGNWRLIFREVSYFESFGPPSPIGHLWSLAVEEQFYVLWPLLVVLLLRLVPKRGILAVASLVLAAASALAMALLYEPGADPSRVYYGTDTRAFGMLIGAALAVVWPSWKLAGKDAVPRKTPLLLDLVGGAGLLVALYMIFTAGEYDPFLYQGGMVLLSVATAAVVAALVHPAGRIGALLGAKPLRWLGVRSYGIYLWHYPVIVLSAPAVDTSDFHPLRTVLQLGATLALAALSWTFIEEPIRQGALGKLRKRTGDRVAVRKRASLPALAAFAGLALAAAVVFVSVGRWLPGDARAASSTAFTEEAAEEGRAASLGAGQQLWPGQSAGEADGGDETQPSTGPKQGGGPAGPETGGADTASGQEGGTDSSANGPEQAGRGEAAQPPDSPPAPNGGESGRGEAGKDAEAGDAAPPDTPADGGAAGTGGTAGPSGTTGAGADGGPSGSGGQGGSDGQNGTGADGGQSGSGEAASPPSQPPAGPSDPPASESDARQPEEPDVKSGKGVTAIGDSIMLDIKPYLEELLPGIAVDGKIGRQMREAQAIVDGLRKDDKLGSRVIIALGSNGAFPEKQLTKLLDSLKEADQVLLVNTRVPRAWEDSVNEMLKETAEDYDNVTVVDWHAASKGEDGYFAKDGVHLKISGSKAFALLVAGALD